ncbi:MAG: TonB family protein [Myxococcales bacterium]|nr:TonB family protein [Myxococcales bacterium]
MAAPYYVRRFSTTIGLSLSVGLHASLVAIAFGTTPGAPSPHQALTLDLEILDTSAGSGPEAAAPMPEPEPEPQGPRRSPQNIDTFEPGAGGSGKARGPVANLASRIDLVFLEDTLQNQTHRSQVQRIATSTFRVSPAPQRTTPNPGIDVLVASDDGPSRDRNATGDHRQRRQRPSPDQFETGTTTSESTRSGRGTRTSPGERRGSASRRPRPEFLRPSLERGPARTTSEWHATRVEDNRDAALLSRHRSPAGTHAAPQGAPEEGEGRGGAGSGGEPGVGGGNQPGGRARPASRQGGSGSITDHPAYVRWLAEQRRRVESLLIFPRKRLLALDQGTAVYRMRVRADGTLVGPPHLVRSSGFEDFDREALRALRRATPFGSVPPEILENKTELRMTFAVAFSNPLFR